MDQYAAYRKRLFLELVEFKHSHAGWRIQYKRDPVDADVTAPPKVAHHTATVNRIGDVELDGIATARCPETFAPFHDLQLLDPSGSAAPAGRGQRTWNFGCGSSSGTC